MSAAEPVELDTEAQEKAELETAEDLDDFCVDDLGDASQAASAVDFSAEVATLVSAIGIIDESGATPFIRGEYCANAVDRLEYLLRMEYAKNRRLRDEVDDDDKDNNELYNKCGEFMVFSKKLVPCFKGLMEEMIEAGMRSEHSQRLMDIAKCLVRMFCRFTFPLTADANNTTDLYISFSKYPRFLEFQHSAKKALIDNDILHQIIILMSSCGLELDPDDRSDEQMDALEVYLCLLRNILAIPNPANTENFLHDRCIRAFQEEKVMDIMVELTVNIAEEADKIKFLMMDIFFEYFRMEDASSMLSGIVRGASDSQQNTDSDLLAQYEREKAQKAYKRKRTRHNKWGGLSRVRLLDGTTRVQSLGTDKMANEDMRDRRQQARFRPIKERKKRVYLSDGIRKSLIYVADQLLAKSFASLINAMFEILSRKPEFELNDSTDCKKWFQLCSLFLEYHRVRSRQTAAKKAKADGVRFSTLKWYSPSSISCVMKEPLINFVVTRVETLFENRKFKHLGLDIWPKLEEALHVYKEIVRCVYSMMTYGIDAIKVSGCKLFAYIFEDHRGPQLISDMIREYKAHQQTKRCLAYCVEAVFYTLTMIERMQKEGNDVQIRTKKKRKKKKAAARLPREQLEEEGDGGYDADQSMVQVAGMDIADDYEDEDGDEDGEGEEYEFMTASLDFEAFLKSYAANKVVAQYMYLLRDYRSNSAKLNSYICTLLNKLAFSLPFAPLLFQLSYFQLFDEVLSDRSIANDAQFNVVRKLAQKVVREFFSRAKTNPVLFCEILFFKTPGAVDDINDPGSLHRQIAERAEQFERRKRRGQQRMNEDGEDSEEDSEEEYQGLDIDMTPWSEEEDTLLRNYYGTYSMQANVDQIMLDFLETELHSTRSIAQISHRLQQLGLRSRRRKNAKHSAPKKRVKPRELSSTERKSIIYHSVHRAIHVQRLQRHDDEKEAELKDGDEAAEDAQYAQDAQNRAALAWMKDKLMALRDLIISALPASVSALSDDVAIIPTEKAHFSFVQNLYAVDLLRKLGFLAPSRYTGTCWWRIPREFKTTDIGDMAQWMEEALALPIDADLKALGIGVGMGSAAHSERAAGHGAMASSHPRPSNVEEQAEVEVEAEDESEEEYEPREQRRMAEGGDGDEAEKKRKRKANKERKKRRRKEKKEKKESKKKRKSRKRKRPEADEEEEKGARKRRKLNLNTGDGDGDVEGDSFFDDVHSDSDRDREGEQKEKENTDTENRREMNSSAIKLKNLDLKGNEHSAPAAAADADADTDREEEELIVHKKKSKRRFVSDSESD